MRFASLVGASASLIAIAAFAACSSSSSDAPSPADAGGDTVEGDTGAPDGGPDSGPAPGPADAKSGTRIKALYHETDDGFSSFWLLRDSKLDADCYVSIAEAGTP